MTSEQTRRVEELYDLLAGAEPGQWSRMLDEQCPDDPAVRAEVLSLLKQSAATIAPQAGASSHNIKAAFENLGAGAADPLIGTDVGPYHIVEKLGEGGMGAVYRARQTRPVRRDVAIKLIRQGMDSQEVLARFEAERQALAMMDHPNVARVLDAGTDGHGRPYFVMDFVPGEPITGYCDRHNLTTRARLELFAKVCDAVQHAHTKGIIHRDIKPSNVLVAVKEEKPVPTVIDFGVAKAVSQRLTEREYFTEYGRIIGTPEYMSPEQAEMNQLDVDARSDIYSLGVLLYELLSGSLPFDSRTLRSAAYNEIQRIIREVDPPRPSTRLSSLDVTDATRIAQRRRETLPALASELRQELEWIPLKAIRKDRTERYRTAMELADDVRNYLAGKPLIAGPEAVTYKLKKFVRRNRGRVVAATTAAAVIFGTAVVAFVMITRARNVAVAALAEAEAQRSRAERNFGLADGAVKQFFTDVGQDQRLEQAELRQLRGTLRQSAVDYLAKMRDQLRDDPKTQSELADAINKLAQFAIDFGDIPPETLLNESLPIQRQIASSHPDQKKAQRDVATTIGNLGQVKHMLGEFDAAKKNYDDAAAILKALSQANPNDDEIAADHAVLLRNLGTLFRQQGLADQAEASYKQALEIQQAIAAKPGGKAIESQASVATTCTDLGLLLDDQGKFGQSIQYYDRAVKARQAIATIVPQDGAAQRELANSIYLLGEAQLRNNNPADGQANLLKAKQSWQGIVNDPKLRDLSQSNAVAFATIAWLEMLVGDPARALEPAKLASFAYPEMPEVQLNLAHALMFAGKVDEARTIYRSNWLKQIPGEGTFAQRARNDFDTLQKRNRALPSMRQIEAELMQVSAPGP